MPSRSTAEATDERYYPGFDEFHRLLPELKPALVAMGVQEKARRDTTELRQSTDKTLGVANLSLAVALIAVAVAVLLAVID